MHVVYLLLLIAFAASCSSQTLLIAHKWADSVGYYDAASGKALATLPVGVRPHEMVFSPDRKLAYVTIYGLNTWTQTEPGENKIFILDVPGRKQAGLIDLGQYRRPHGIEVGRKSGKLYVTADQPPSLLVIDPVKRVVEQRFDAGQKAPHMVALTRDETRAYVANSGSASVTVISLDGKSKPAVIETGGIPMGIELTSDEKFCYLAARENDQIAVIDTSTNRVVHRLDVKGKPVRLRIIGNDSLLIASLIGSGEAVAIDLKSRKEVHRLKVGTAAEGLYVDPTGRFLYVSAQGDDKVVKFDLKTWKPVLEVRTASRPDPILEF